MKRPVLIAVLSLCASLVVMFFGFHDAKVLIHSLRARQVHFFEDMIITAGYENPGFLDAGCFNQLKIRRVGAYPRRDFRKAQAERLTTFQRFPILVGIEKELALPHQPLGPAQP